VLRGEQNGPGFHYVVRWRQQPQRQRVGNSSGELEFEERKVPANSTQLVIGALPVFCPYDVYVIAVNDIGPAVAAPHLVRVYTGEDGMQTVYCFLM